MPRCVFSREDAMFCARVMLKFQTLHAANYSLPFMVNAVFGEVLCLLRACTLQETEYMSVFLKEVFMLLESTCTEEWLAKHPVIGQQTKHLTLVEWEKLQRKFQVLLAFMLPVVTQGIWHSCTAYVLVGSLGAILLLAADAWPGTHYISCCSFLSCSFFILLSPTISRCA